MIIGFIGAGRVGTSLGKYLSENGFAVSGFYSKTKSSAEESAEFIGGSASSYTGLKKIITDSDLIFITVNDGAIADVSHKIAGECRKYDIDISNKVFCHTSGALSSTVLSELKTLNAETASIHMLLAVNDKFTSYKDFREAFFTVEGSGVPAEVLKKCGSSFQILSAENKSKYHAAAVFASNFVVALSELSCELLEECGFSYDDAFAAIRPLLKNNINNILKSGPKNALTGPIERGDFETVKRHLECFKNSEPDITAKKVYAAVSEALIRQTGRQPDSETAELLKNN